MVLMIQPLKQEWLFTFKLPINYLSKIRLNHDLRLSLPESKKLRRFDIVAKVVHIAKLVHTSKGESNIEVRARVINPLPSFLNKLPLDGYLIGGRKSWFNWFREWMLAN
jgi:hypothetical protein